MKEITCLIYVGRGSSLPGVPARDLTQEEVNMYGGEGDLLLSGLYEKPAVNKMSVGPKQNKSKVDEKE